MPDLSPETPVSPVPDETAPLPGKQPTACTCEVRPELTGILSQKIRAYLLLKESAVGEGSSDATGVPVAALHLASDGESGPPKRPMPWWPWLLLSCALLLVSAVVLPLIWLNISGRSELAAALVETDSLDPNWRWRDLSASVRKVPDEENGWMVVESLYPTYRSLTLRYFSMLGAYSRWVREAYRPYVVQHLYSPVHLLPGYTAPSGSPCRTLLHERMAADARDELNRLMPAIPYVWPTLQRISTFPHLQCPPPDNFEQPFSFANPTPSAMLDGVYGLSMLVLEWQLESRQFVNAENCLLLLWRIQSVQCDMGYILGCDMFVDWPSWFHTSRATERVLAFTELSPETLKYIAAQAAFQEQHNLLLYQTRARRAVLHEWFTEIENGRLPIPVLEPRSPSNSVLEDLVENIALAGYRICVKCSIRKVHAASLRRANRWHQFAQQPRESLLSQLVLSTAPPELSQRDWWEDLWSPGPMSLVWYRCREKEGERLLNLRLLRAALAVELFRLEHGRWPDIWQELIPQYLQAVPADPCRPPHPLLLRRTAEGVVIYAVGQDGTDDGGHPERDCSFYLFDLPLRHAYRIR